MNLFLKVYMKRSTILALLFIPTLSLTVLAQPTTVSPMPVSFAVVPQQAAGKLARLWTPLLLYLSAKTGHEFVFKTAKDIPTFERRLAAGKYDMAYMNPYHYTVFHRSPGYVAFAKQKDVQIKGLLVVRKDSPYQSLHDLAGQTLAFPSPAAFAATVLTRGHLSAMDIPFTPTYVSSHDSVYLSVAKGFYAAGGGVVRTLKNIAPGIQDQLHILWLSPSYTPHAIAAHPRVPPAVVKHVQSILERMHHDPEGRALLQALRFTGIDVAHDTDWDDIRALDIQLLQVPTQRLRSVR